MSNFPDYKTVATDSLIPYARNSRTHSDEQVAQIAASIREFGFLNPIIIDGDNGIIAGHGRVLAAQRLGMETLPCIEASHLTDTQRRAYIIADNKLALNAGWDDDMLRIELDELGEMGFDLELTGFSLDEVDELLISPDEIAEAEASDNPYTDKVDAPTYEPTGEKPSLDQVFDESKALGMIEDIKKSSLPDEEKRFLMAAASRHIVFNYANAAEYYAHASAECQRLMEDSAMVIVDFDKAIEQGYVKVKQEMADQFLDENPEAVEDEE